MAALEKLVSACLKSRRAFAIDWVDDGYQPEYPRMRIKIGHRTWTLFFTRGKRGWGWKTAATATQEVHTLTHMLALISGHTA